MSGAGLFRRAALLVLALSLPTACDGETEQSGSAVIVTTTERPGSAVIVTTTERPDVPDSSTPTDTTPTTPTSTDSSAPTTPTAPTSPPTATAAPTTESPGVGDPRVTSIVVANFDDPVDLAVRPGDDALYVVEQSGRIMQLDDDRQTVVADLTDRTAANGERGLLGLAFAPHGDLAYLDYTDSGGTTVVAEYPVDDAGRLDVAAERILLTVDQPYSNHNGGHLEFGPDGMLLIALGDGGSGGDPERRASDPTSLLGSLLRIDPRPEADQPYTIPTDNPFVDGDLDGIAGAPEVWAWGLRNPWKFDFDPVTGDLWIADVGQNKYEEINQVAPVGDITAGRGVDFGWSAFEGTERFNDDVADTGNSILPVLTYRHGDDGCSISGGVPYRGTAIAELASAYVYSDLCSGIVWALDLPGNRNITLIDGFESVTAVRPGPDGEIYVLEHAGALNRLVPSG